MKKHFGWLGLLVGLTLVPSACDDNDALPGASAGTSSGGSAGTSSAGTGGSSEEAGTGGSSTLAGGGGADAQGGSSTAATGGSASGSAGRGGAAAHGGSAGKGGTNSEAGGAGEGGEAGQAGARGHAGEAGNGGEGGSSEPEPIELAGTWENSLFGQTDVITSSTWSQDYGTGPTVSGIVKFSNAQNYAIRLAPADAAYNPDTYDRTVWLEIDGDHFYYCTIDFGLPTAEAAEASTTPVDTSDPENTGCGGSFPWTKMTRP